MANITEQVKQIRAAAYGRDVRESIASGLEEIKIQCDETEISAQSKITEMSELATSLNEAEVERVEHEDSRITNESTRTTSEDKRVQTETERNTRFNNLNEQTTQLQNTVKAQQDTVDSQQEVIDQKISDLTSLVANGSFDGSYWLSGNGVPSNTIGRNRDWYVDISSPFWNVYQKANDTWTSTGKELVGKEGGLGGDTVPIGTMLNFTGVTPQDGWLVCDGRAISRTDYKELFAVIGTNYGAGNGTTTFNIPNEPNPISYTLTSADVAQLKTHEPALKVIIKAKQVVPIIASVEDNLTSDSTINALSAKQGKVLKNLVDITNSKAQNVADFIGDNASNICRSITATIANHQVCSSGDVAVKFNTYLVASNRKDVDTSLAEVISSGDIEIKKNGRYMLLGEINYVMHSNTAYGVVTICKINGNILCQTVSGANWSNLIGGTFCAMCVLQVGDIVRVGGNTHNDICDIGRAILEIVYVGGSV